LINLESERRSKLSGAGIKDSSEGGQSSKGFFLEPVSRYSPKKSTISSRITVPLTSQQKIRAYVSGTKIINSTAKPNTSYQSKRSNQTYIMAGQTDDVPFRITTPKNQQVALFDSPHHKQKKYFESLKKRQNENDMTM
jgi:hypothetical protein